MPRLKNQLQELAGLWRQFTWRHWLQAPGSTIVLTGILALGVGVFFSIRLANRAAVSGFSLFTETLNGTSDLVVTSPSGRLPTEALREVRQALGNLPVSLFPVLESTATAPSDLDRADGFNAEQYHVVGVDLLALPNLIFLNPPSYRPPVDFSKESPSREPNEQWSLETGTAYDVFITKKKADADQLKIGHPFDLIINDQRASFTVAGIIPENDFSAQKPAELLVMDLPRLQELTQKQGHLDRVELRIPSGPLYDTWLKEASSRLAQNTNSVWHVENPERQRQTGAVMTRAFRLNLTILSGLALIVGLYLILQALEAAVIKRRGEIGTLRSLGVGQDTLLRAWMLESIVLGVVGTTIGLAVGYVGAQFAVGAIAKTVNSLYFSNTTSAASWHWGEASFAFCVGIAASALAGWLPARDAAATPPAQVLARGNRSEGLRFLDRPWLGFALVISGFIAYLLPPLSLGPGVQFPLAGYLTALAWVIGGSILCGIGYRPCSRLFSKLFASSAQMTYAASQLRRPSGRHRLTAAGLLVAVGMAAGMGLLIQSFEKTMVTWIQQALKADLYVAVQGVGNISSNNRIQESTWKQLAATAEIEEVELGQMYPIQFRGASTYLVGASFGNKSGWRHMVWVTAPQIEFSDMNHESNPVPAVINESFHQRFSVQVGETLQVPTPEGQKQLKVVGIFADYGNERGSIVVSRPLLAAWYDDTTVLNVAAHLKPGVDAEIIRRRWMQTFPGLVVRTNRHLREEVMIVFHETFSVTHALKWIGVSVALIGLGLGLWSILLERRNELRVLKELGMSRHQIAQTVAMEGMGLAAVAIVGGLLLSVALGHLLVYVINYQSFGWTLAFRIPWSDMLQLSIGVLSIGGIVSYIVGHRSAKLPSDQEE